MPWHFLYAFITQAFPNYVTLTISDERIESIGVLSTYSFETIAALVAVVRVRANWNLDFETCFLAPA